MMTLAACLLVASAASNSASAKTPIRVGIGDQQSTMFDNPAFKRAKFKRVRYVIPWNVMDDAATLERARDYVVRARAEGIQVLLHLSTDNYTARKAKLPSVAQYRREVRQLVPYFRKLGVREFGVWNEANHVSQPTYNSPTKAALFFVEMYRAVKTDCRSCGVVALDVLDQRGVERYIQRFYGRLSTTYRRRATIVGLHNYGDVNRLRLTYTRAMIGEARKFNSRTKFWLTETGGIVRFGSSFPYSPYRAKLRTRQMFKIANTYRSSGIDRLYVYSWTGAERDDRFDAGLTNPDGSVRPAYTYLRAKLPNYLR